MFDGQAFVFDKTLNDQAIKIMTKSMKERFPEFKFVSLPKPPLAMFRNSMKPVAVADHVRYYIVAKNVNMTREAFESEKFIKLPSSCSVLTSEWISNLIESGTVPDEAQYDALIGVKSNGKPLGDTDAGTATATEASPNKKARLGTYLGRVDRSIVMLPTTLDMASISLEQGMWHNVGTDENDACAIYKLNICSHANANPTTATTTTATDGATYNKHQVRIAAFDMDGTIIQTNSGNTYPKNINDWRFWKNGQRVKAKLQELHNNHYHVVIMSNQSGVKTTVQEKQIKVDKILNQLSLPVSYLAATGQNGTFRKPCTGMWDMFAFIIKKYYQNLDKSIDVVIDTENSIYVGDAAGRIYGDPQKRKKNDPKNDFSDSDFLFALNIGCQFLTPEALFLNDKNPIHNRIMLKNPHVLDVLASSSSSSSGNDISRSRLHQSLGPVELVLFLAPAASGKSSLARQFERSGYARVNQDELKTKAKCMKVAREKLNSRQSVVVDNTNLDRNTRIEWLELASEMGLKARIIVFQNISNDLSLHLARVRYHSGAELRDIPANVIALHYSQFNEAKKCDHLAMGFARVDNYAWMPTTEVEVEDEKETQEQQYQKNMRRLQDRMLFSYMGKVNTWGRK
jgi:bifunctional polynucleotide phosphatase/kinase